MDLNANQRKRTGRLAKTDNTEGMGPPPQVIDNNEVLKVTALSISPALEEGESTNNVPAAECRRSSRKKIIKFDVRDLLNKNRKPHKIQIEARIDSNAPTTSKTSTATSGELTSAKPLTISGDLLTKQKTFLEKSAIFRRYSISQEPKPPPPPLPLPPSLLAKAGDSNDATGTGGTTSRRLSRTQEFFSNVMIKPKQTTSLIVAQMESSAPSIAGKRKSLNKFVETESSNSESIDATTVQKRRGRPSKTKLKTSEETNLATKEDTQIKKLTPEKATNWKEYKACLAQQTGTGNEDLNTQENIEDTLTADVLIEISSTSSHNSNIEEPFDSKSLIDEQHHGYKKKDDPPEELNLIPEISIDGKNDPHSSINPLTRQVDLNQAYKNENQMKDIKTTASQQIQEKVVQVKPRETKESSVDDDVKIAKEANSSQLNINESLETKSEGKAKLTSANRDESSQELKSAQFSNEKSTANQDQAVLDIPVHKEKGSETNKDEKSIAELEVMESKENVSSTIANDSSQIVKQLAQWSAEQATEFLNEAFSDHALPKEKVEQNIDNTNEAKQDDNLQSNVDTKDLQSFKEVTKTRESRSKHNKSPQEQDTKDLQSSKEVTNTRQSRSKHNKSPQEQDLLLKGNKFKNSETTNRRSRSKHNNSPQEKTDTQSMHDKTKLGSPLPKEIKQNISKVSKDETIIIKDPPELDVSLQKDQVTILEQSSSEKISKQDDDLRTDSKFEDGQSPKEAMKNTRSASKMKVPEETAGNIIQSTKEAEITSSKETKKKFSTQKKEEPTEASAFEELKDKEDLLSISERTEIKEVTTETLIQNVTETTPRNKRKTNKKAINEQKGVAVETAMADAANESKRLGEKLDMEDKQEEVFEKIHDDKDITIKKSPRNKRNLNKKDESLKHAEYRNDSSTSKNSNDKLTKLNNTTEQTTIGEVTGSDNNILLTSEEIINLKRTELKTPDPSCNTTQDEHENTPNIKIPTNENTNQEGPLSQPSTPLDKKSLTFSRTSSSSESENQSERSSYSSATTSSTSTSTRSYKSGDKLKISLKRISLPQSPSSSSQISTPEQQCSPSLSLSEDIKKKLPKAKRSKRLQKKFVELLDNQNVAENIDDCFQKITTPNKDELQLSNTPVDIIETEPQSINVAEQLEENVAKVKETTNILEKSNEIDTNKYVTDDKPVSIELEQKQIKCVSTEEFVETATDLIDTIKPTTSKVKHINDNSNIIKRKSLRNRKDNDSTETETETKESQEETERKIEKKENDQDENLVKETKESVSIVAETVEESIIEQQQEQLIEIQTAQDSDNLESEEQQEKLIEIKQKPRNRKLKDPRLSIIKPKQQQKQKPKDEQTDPQENEKQELEKQLEVPTKENQQDKIETEKQEELLTETSCPPAVEREDVTIEIPHKTTTVGNDEKQPIDAIESLEDKDKFKAGQKSKEIDFISELKTKESFSIPTKTDEFGAEVNEKKYSTNTPTKSKSLKDESSITNIAGKSVRSCTDSKDTETSKITSTRSKTAKDKTISNAESSKTSTKCSDELAKADIQTLQKEFSEIGSPEEKPKDDETDSTKNEEASSSIKHKETSLLPHKEANDELPIDVIHMESITQKTDLPAKPYEDTFKNNPEVTERQSPTPLVSTKTKPDPERPTSAKRKSLRNQKEFITNVTNDESSLEKSSAELTEESQVIIEEPIFTVNTLDVKENKLAILSHVNVAEPIKVPKRRGRKSRFKNLHSPEAESETESSTGKQTPIEETSFAEKKDDDPTLNATENVEVLVKNDNKTDKDNELLKNNEKDLTAFSKEHTEDDETLTVGALNENDEVDNEEKSSTEPDLVQESVFVSDDSMKASTTQTAPSESYIIQNVSIATNTLLDILRTVQSNTAAAALEANNKKTENPLEEMSTKDENNIPENPKPLISEDLPSNSQDRNAMALKSLRKLDTDSNTNSPTRCDTNSPLTLKSLRKLDTDSNTNSPTRCDTNSPLALKKVNISPTRSDSNSPLTLKKVGLSPTRSDTSSPLTLKKVTRRYERRSRRGEDSDHKTLEETFAEIAAQSSKAVLAAKSFDSNDEFPLGEVKLKDDEPTAEHEVEIVAEDKLATENQEKLEVTSLNVGVAEVFEKVKDIENDSAEIQEKVVDIQENLEYSKNITETEKSEDVEKLSTNIETSQSISPETIIETPVAEKVTPARRGRKPKNRSMEIVLPIAKESEIKNSSKSKKDIEKPTVTNVKDKDLEEVPSVPENTLKTLEEILQKPVSALETPTKLKDDIKLSNEEQDFRKEIRELSQTPELTLKSQDDSKVSKKSNKKSDASKELLTTPTETEDDVRTPKQTVKKRDSSLTKSETKSQTKKSSKKSKNNEEEQKEDTIPKTTTPPPKRGRKPKNQQEANVQTTNSSKKKNKMESCTENDEADNVEDKRKDLESESESVNTSLDKSLDEKMAKKKRQKKLKEAFEAALTDDLNKTADLLSNNSNSLCSTSSSSHTFGLTLLNKSPPPETSDSLGTDSIRETCLTPVDEDPDPLKDIEKFIADGVNLLKKDYKLDEDSVGDVITTTINTNESEEIPLKSAIEEDKPIYNTFETPADTPVTTPSITPPPKSPISLESTTPDENSGVRRSHRIKLITQTPKALVGRGLVRDKERFSIKDDVETKSHYTLDDHLLDLAEVEAKNAKFLKEMEERLSNFQVIKENEYLCERVISREARKMICDCFLTHEEEERGELGCGEDCLNRLLMIECGPECNVKERCTNKRFQKLLCSPCRVFRTEKKGFGIMADIEILPGEFIMEYVGEVIDTDIFEQRRIMYSQDKNRHYYFMALRSDAIIDATIQGNISRFINHSCDPNAETQKWTVNGELRIGFFSRKSIMPGEEITFNYQYQRYGREAQRCYCESSNCRGWIGQEPTSDEGEQIDDDDYEESEDDEEEEEEQDTSNLLVHDDDEDSDASVTDPEEVQKKLEMAAAQAEVELAPIKISEDLEINKDALQTENKENDDSVKPETEEEEDSKSKFKKLLTKMAEKVAAKQKQNKRQQKLQRKKKSKESSADITNKLRFSEDPDIEDEVEFLRECGLKNQSDTLRLSRLMVRAKLVQTRLNLLDILQKGDLPCRRLFLDYHGLRLVHGWMSEDAGNMQIRLALLQTLETLPIANKTVLTDSKVMQMVRNWCGNHTTLSPNEDSSSSNSNSQDNTLQPNTNIEEGSDLQELHKLALKLITTWEGLPEIFRIPKKERIEQMKEHEREADRQYAANAETEENKTSTDRYRRNRFGTTSTFPTTTPSNRFTKPNNGNPLRTLNTKHESTTNLSKAQRREMFAAKVARDEAEKRMAEERREFETKCRFFGLDPKKTRPQDVPFCVNPATGQWYSVERKPIITPPSYTHVQVPVKPKSTDPNDYQLPAACSTLTAQWKYAITPQGKIYYYHIKYRIPQWEPPTPAQLQLSEMEADDDDSEGELTTTAGEDSSEDDDEILIGMDAVQLRAYIDRKVETRRQKRYQRLVDQRAISPRREEDRVYNQIEVRKYKENKEKIRKRKEEIRRKRAEALRQSSLNMCTLGSVIDATGLKLQTESDEELGVLPIQDYLLSSDEDGDLKTDVNSALLDKIVEGDKIVDELDALTSKRQLKRPLPPHRDLNEPSTSSLAVLSSIEKQEYKKRKLEKKDKKKPKDQDAKYRKNKEKFRCEIAGIIVHYLKPYRRETCPKGHIQTNDDFNHLARKLTHFVMIKELKYCESVGQTLVVTESVKNKSREFIKKYMAKYGDVYVKPTNDPDFKDIPFTL